MLIYTLNAYSYAREKLIEEYESVIWTERWIEPGDFRLTLPATHENAVMTRPETLLECEDSREPMLVETREVQDGMITATGKTLEKFFDERMVGAGTYFAEPPVVLKMMVDNMQSRDGGAWAIRGLRTGIAVDTGEKVTVTLEKPERAHEQLLKVAKTYSVGMHVVLVEKEEPLWPSDRELVFSTRVPLDRSSYEIGSEFVRFSPNDDTFANIHELWSVADEVNFLVGRVPTWVQQASWWDQNDWLILPSPHGASDGKLSSMYNYRPFTHRVREIDTEEITLEVARQFYLEVWGPREGTTLTYPTFDDLPQVDKVPLINELVSTKLNREWPKLNTERKIAVDGEVAENAYQYDSDYHLGDKVAVEGTLTGGPYARRPMVISEYIRTADGTGKRAYPTLTEPPQEFDDAISPENDGSL